MTIGEAIEILNLKVKYEYSASKTKEGDAVKLGIEALRRENQKRQNMSFHPEDLLPGETEE